MSASQAKTSVADSHDESQVKVEVEKISEDYQAGIEGSGTHHHQPGSSKCGAKKEKGNDNPGFQGDKGHANHFKVEPEWLESKIKAYLCTKCQVEAAVPTVPILTNDRPYSIEVYDCGNDHKIEVLRVHIDQKGPSRVEMGKIIHTNNRVQPHQESIGLKSTSTTPKKYTTEKEEPDVIEQDGEHESSTNESIEHSDEPERQQWSNPIEFLLSCIAMSVGLGNVWRFPFTAYENGGGAFLIPYLLVLFFIGRPLYFLELSLGQFSSKSSVKVWDMVPFFRGIGYGQAIGTASVVSYYTCLIALSVFYLFASMQSVLPWTICNPDIILENTVCISAGANATEVLINGSFAPDTQVIGSAEQYFLHTVLKQKDDIFDGIGLPDLKLVGCLAACYVVLFLTFWKGVAGAGKVAYFTAIFPYLVLFTLLGRGVTLPGAVNGIMFYITPQWSQLLNIKVWYAAVTQSFFSLSVGFGALFAYSSYNGFTHNVYRDAIIISIADTFTSLLAGFTIFAVLGNLAEELNVPIEKVIKSGAGLAFVSYPMAIAKFDYVPQLFAVLFFLMLFTLGLGSSAGLISSLIAIISDTKPEWNKTYVAAIVCVSGFLVGLVYLTPGGQHILNLVDFYGGGFMIFVFAILEVIAISWIYGLSRVIPDIKFMLGIELGIYWKFCWGLLIPVALGFFFCYSTATAETLTYGGVAYPDIAINAGLILTAVALLQVPFWGIYAVFTSPKKNFLSKIKSVFKPSNSWGPKNPRQKLEWMKIVVEREINEVLEDYNSGT